MAQPGPLGPPGLQVPAAPPTREIQLNAPPTFDGNRKKFNNFLQAVLLHISLNAHIFNTNELNIRFTLSFLTEKEAAQWRESWVQRNNAAGAITYPTWAAFEAELSAAFQPIDLVGNAMHKLETLRQGGKTAEELNTERDLLVGQAAIGADSAATFIKAYQKVLNRSLLEKILDGDTVPTTIDSWKLKAVQLDNNYRRKMAILGKTRDNHGQNTGGGRPFCPAYTMNTYAPQRDPNAMDVDALSIKAREEAMRKGACFGCGEIGYISHNCPKKRGYGQGGQGGNTGQPGQSGMPGKTWTKGKDLLAHICSLTTGLSAKEHEELMKEAKELKWRTVLTSVSL